MNPVIGLDVSKGESHAQAFSDRGTPHGKTFRFNHNLEGLASFLRYAQNVESFAGQCPAIQYLYIVIDPLISHQAKKMNLRKVKTDVADAH